MSIFDKINKRRRDSDENNRRQNADRSTNKGSGQYVRVDQDAPSPLAIIYRSEFDYISRCILDYPNLETGGQLFGFWTSVGTPIVMYAIGPGRNAAHNRISFVQDQEYLHSVGIAINSKYRLQHIGEWHSHHQLDLAYPSGGDVENMKYGVGQPGFPRLLLCIGNYENHASNLNAFNFHEKNYRNYAEAKWDIVELESPFRALIDKELRNLLIHPNTQKAQHANPQAIQPAENPKKKEHWLTQSVDNVVMMKGFVTDVKTLLPSAEVCTEMSDNGEPLISINDGKVKIILPYSFPELPPELHVKTEDNGFVTVSCTNAWTKGHWPLEYKFRSWLDSAADDIKNAISPQMPQLPQITQPTQELQPPSFPSEAIVIDVTKVENDSESDNNIQNIDHNPIN